MSKYRKIILGMNSFVIFFLACFFMAGIYNPTTKVTIEEKTPAEMALGEKYDKSFLKMKTWLGIPKEVTLSATQLLKYRERISREREHPVKHDVKVCRTTGITTVKYGYSSYKFTGKNLLTGEQEQSSFSFKYAPIGNKLLNEFEAQKGFENAASKKVTFTLSHWDILIQTNIVLFLWYIPLLLGFGFFIMSGLMFCGGFFEAALIFYDCALIMALCFFLCLGLMVAIC